LSLKTDSYVVESNVHFPTDYNLLWDCSRKAIDTIEKFKVKYPSIEGWRKLYDWYKSLKNLNRALGKASSCSGKNREYREKQSAKQYLIKAIAFKIKLDTFLCNLVIKDRNDLVNIIALERFIILIDKHIDLVERRILKGEKIPHEEKIFSIFEEYTEWITKGKQRPNVELGKRLAITTDQFGLLIDYHIMDKESDSDIVIKIADRILNKHKVYSWSFDKGFWHKDNKWLLETQVEKVVMPKKGKLNKIEWEHEHNPIFKKLRNKHSAIESNINELENRGLDRCPDRGYHGFSRYIGIGIVAYNLHRIGRQLIKIEHEKQLQSQKIKLRNIA